MCKKICMQHPPRPRGWPGACGNHSQSKETKSVASLFNLNQGFGVPIHSKTSYTNSQFLLYSIGIIDISYIHYT